MELSSGRSPGGLRYDKEPRHVFMISLRGFLSRGLSSLRSLGTTLYVFRMQRPPVNQQRISPGIESTHVQDLGEHEYNVYDKLVQALQEMMAPVSRQECCLAVSGFHMAHPLKLCRPAARDLAASALAVVLVDKGAEHQANVFLREGWTWLVYHVGAEDASPELPSLAPKAPKCGMSRLSLHRTFLLGPRTQI